ncbi:hypothetical protein B566_EDAN008033 [Ephemera danica]|nr:hypothetical protein B566_EDAN008033 [Ephemera danica]
MDLYVKQLLLNERPHPYLIRMMLPRYEEYANMAARLKSFEGHSFPIPVEDLADAGFFCRDGSAVCYQCAGGLYGFDTTDVAWEEHAYWFRCCPFVLTMKGTDYVNAVISKKEDHKTSKPEGKTTESEVDPLCIVCLTNVADVLFLPCKHLASCRNCKLHLVKCPICRSKCEYIILVYHT